MTVTGWFIYFFSMQWRSVWTPFIWHPDRKLAVTLVFLCFPVTTVSNPLVRVSSTGGMCQVLSHLLRSKVTWMCWDTTWWSSARPQHPVLIILALGTRVETEILMQKAPRAILCLFTGFIDWVRIFHFNREHSQEYLMKTFSELCDFNICFFLIACFANVNGKVINEQRANLSHC